MNHFTRIKKKNIILLATIILLGLVFTNFNAFLSLVFNVKSLATFALLFISIFIVYQLYFNYGYRLKYWLVQLILLFFILYIFIGTVSYLWDPSELHEKTSLVRIYRNYFSSIILITAFYLGTKFILLEKGESFLIKTLVGLFLVTSLFIIIGPYIGLSSIYNNVSYSVRTGERDSGFFGNPNEAGAFANYTLVIILSCLMYFKKRKWFWILLIPLPVYAALVSFSKASIIITAIILFGYITYNLIFFLKIGNKNRYYAILFWLASGFLLVSFISNFDTFYNSLEKNQRYRIDALFVLASGKLDVNSTSERNIIFEHAFQKIKKRPFLGNGIGSYHRFNDGPRQLGTHNTLLLIQGESGIIPTILFIIFVVAALFMAFRIKSNGIRFLVLGIIFVFVFSRVTFSHTALKDRISNGLLGISIALLTHHTIGIQRKFNTKNKTLKLD